MNAVLKTEAIAIETAVPLEAADPTKNLLLVPLSQLQPRRSKRNTRTTPRLSIPELAASIARVGLLQNLVVILAADGEQYEVVAGDRRLTALKLLAKKKRIAADQDVQCLLVAEGTGWMPAVFQTEHHTEPEGVPGAAGDAGAAANADEEVEAHALAA